MTGTTLIKNKEKPLFNQDISVRIQLNECGDLDKKSMDNILKELKKACDNMIYNQWLGELIDIIKG